MFLEAEGYKKRLNNLVLIIFLLYLIAFMVIIAVRIYGIVFALITALNGRPIAIEYFIKYSGPK